MKKFVTFAALLLLAGCEAPDPEERLAALHLPPPGFKGEAAQGAPLFSTYCQACHGADGTGTEQGPPLVNDVYRPKHHADFAFHMAVRDGVRQHHWGFGDMPAVADITPEQTGHIVAYIRREQSNANIQ
ncbi:c-type cytochrome [Sedimenticola hydrogenitrophicus]|uniref:c-type cytochrome n=1 Tax=Sedimenticola hydrogenitrophicus TaxID=2967975 RepID=UPI0021A45233|nr:cytochrome c [Sedimenticola hydrogenitrophicus]